MEPLTTADVTAVLQRHIDERFECVAVERGPIGNGQETWFVDAASPDGDTQLVLRRTAAAGPLEWTSRAAEAEVMRAVRDSGVPVPAVHAVVTDPGVLGAPFMVMDMVSGASLFTASSADRERLSVELVGHLWKLHRAAIPDPQGRDAAQATRDEIEHWRHHYVTNRIEAVPLVDALLAWCAAAVPASLADIPAVQIWGDAGAHNALGQDGRVTGLLDWELAHPGHPLEDLAAAIWIEGDTGVPETTFIQSYEDASGHRVDHDVLQYFLALTCLTRSIMIIIGAAAFTTGRTGSPTLAGLGLDLPAVNLGTAATHAGWGQVPDVPSPTKRSPLSPSDGVADAAPPDGPFLAGPRPTGAEIDDGIATFLREEVLPQVEAPRTRRGIKTAAALLDTAAHRARIEANVNARRTQADAELLATCAAAGVSGNLASVAARVEADGALADLRPLLRTHLLADLALTRSLLTPLRRLYGR